MLGVFLSLFSRYTYKSDYFQGGKQMKKENVLFLSLAIITVICIMSIGVAIAERSPLIGLLAIIGVFIATGLGFTLRKKLRESGEL